MDCLIKGLSIQVVKQEPSFGGEKCHFHPGANEIWNVCLFASEMKLAST